MSYIGRGSRRQSYGRSWRPLPKTPDHQRSTGQPGKRNWLPPSCRSGIAVVLTLGVVYDLDTLGGAALLRPWWDDEPKRSPPVWPFEEPSVRVGRQGHNSPHQPRSAASQESAPVAQGQCGDGTSLRRWCGSSGKMKTVAVATPGCHLGFRPQASETDYRVIAGDERQRRREDPPGPADEIEGKLASHLCSKRWRSVLAVAWPRTRPLSNDPGPLWWWRWLQSVGSWPCSRMGAWPVVCLVSLLSTTFIIWSVECSVCVRKDRPWSFGALE